MYRHFYYLKQLRCMQNNKVTKAFILSRQMSAGSFKSCKKVNTVICIFIYMLSNLYIYIFIYTYIYIYIYIYLYNLINIYKYIYIYIRFICTKYSFGDL